MATRTKIRPGPARRRSGPAIATIATIATACLGWAPTGVSLADVPPPPSSLARQSPPEPREDMTEELRAQLDSILVVATRDSAGENLSGSYDKDAYGLMEGVAAGHEAGRIRKEVGPVPVSMRIPGTAIPGMIIGGLFGSVQREVQELRDALTEELVDA